MNIDKSPLVSIIITSFNHEKYLDDCIKSILNQTYSNLEIIIIDNNSTDSSKDIILNYSQQDERIKFFPQDKNIYPSGSMNLGIGLSKGEYLSLFSGDDYCSLDKIEIQINYMLTHNINNLFSWVNIVDDNNMILQEHSFNEVFNKVFTNDELELFLLTHGNTLCAGSVLLHKSIFEKYGKFDNRFLQLQDYEMWLRMISKEKLNVLNKKLFNYRVRNDNKNLSLNNENNSAFLRTCFENTQIIKQIINIENDFLFKLVNKPCNDVSKYKNLFEFYIKERKLEFAAGVLIVMFKELDKNKESFNLTLYNEFLNMYSYFDLTNSYTIIQLQEKEQQIQDLHAIVESLRLKNRVKKQIKKVVPSKLLKIARYIKHNPSSIKLGLHILKTQGVKSLYKKIMKINHLSEERILNTYDYCEPNYTADIKKEINEFDYKPLISIIMPVYNVDPKWLDLAIKSIENQWYQNWELCVADDKSTNKKTLDYLKSLQSPKIKIVFLEKNVNISGASNAAIELATGEYIFLMDNDDEITPNALYEVVKVVNETNADFIYSDEDKVEMNGTYCEPHFKPDFAPDMFLSQNYLSHLGVIKKELVDKVKGFTLGLEGAQDYDLYLKVLEYTDKVSHISKVLYHWRKIPGSTAAEFGEKSYAQESGRKSIENAMKRRKINAIVENGKYPGTYKVNYTLKEFPLVSIIIPFKDKPELLDMCINSVLDKSTYKNYEIIGISNNSTEEATFVEMQKLENKSDKVKFYEYDVPFNYSKINNYAVNTYAKGEHIILLNNDIEIITCEWIEEMLMFSQREEIGCVGAKLYYPNDTIQHAGVVIGIGGIAGHSHKYFHRSNPGYISRLNLIQNFSAVTAACLMVKKSIYNQLEGLNEKNLTIAFNDVDFCLRVQERGYKNIFTPYCEAYHHESISRGAEDSRKKISRFNSEVDFMIERHKDILKNGDPYYNRNLTLDREDFSL